ncbi:MAG: Glucokinase [Chlamydiales bacterium]|nr:Glucokinase [Chlamydiales bacterium]MCH9635206.1 Glucokinase [Chlamydiales bacterium]MCH9703185.1 glucokinase [Chlamydiota bacterium]
MVYLAGDIGGTKTNLALFEEGSYEPHHLKTFHSAQYPDLRSIVTEYQKDVDLSGLSNACFAIAGPVQENVCRATNLPWLIEGETLSKLLNLSSVCLINDLEANAHALSILPDENLVQLYAGKKGAHGNQAVVSPGTGLGEAGLYWDGKQHLPFASEGGHCEFGPRDEVQIDLARYLIRRFGHASYERILSGPGLVHLYEFFKDELKRQEPLALTKGEDPAKVITEYAVSGKSDLAVDTLNLFVSILGSESSNTVLKYMAMGGLFLGGGIPPKIMPFLKKEDFLEGFFDKGRFRPLLEEVPIFVISDDKAALKGSAHFCFKQPKGVKHVR